jgi:hypothetical protein
MKGKRTICEFCSSTAELRCDICGADYCELCASEPDEGGFSCPDDGCPGYGINRHGSLGLADFYDCSEGVNV